jgi:hypothetical protein
MARGIGEGNSRQPGISEGRLMTASWRPRTGQAINALYAWVATEPDGGEGICSAQLGDIHMPLVGADMERMLSLRPFAEAAHLATGYPVRLVQFSKRVDLEVLP